MGRRRGGIASALSENPASPHGPFTESECEVLTAMLELCGFWDGNASQSTFNEANACSSRKKLADSIQLLKRHSASMRLQHRDVTGAAFDDAVTNSILELEDCLCETRSEISSYLEEQLQESTEMGDLAMEVVKMTGFYRSTCRAICTAFKEQLQIERQALYRLLRVLDNFYNDESQLEMMIPLDEALRCLKREPMLQRTDFLFVVELFQKTQSRRDQGEKVAVYKSPSESLMRKQTSSTVDASVINEDSVWTAVEAFLLDASLASQSLSSAAKVTSLLLQGEQGAGKTYMCDKLRNKLEGACTVIYPKLPADVLGSAVGETEDIIISWFGAMRSQKGPTVLILDGLEHLVAYDNFKSLPASIPVSSFLSLLDATRQSAFPGSRSLVLGTSTSIREGMPLFSIFDRVFSLSPPGASERKALLGSVFARFTERHDDIVSNSKADELLVDITEATAGKSYAEIAQLCRQGLSDALRADMNQEISTASLCAIQERLQTNTPNSLKQGVIGDSFHLRLLTSRDFRVPTKEEDGSLLKMKGSSAAKAWKELQRSIVVPLCQSKELNSLFGVRSAISNMGLTGGILISGDPGSGKTEIAIHCARYASHLLANLKTLEVACTSLIHKEVGGSEQAIKRMFDCARKATPCILILDGIENIAAVRGNDATTEGTLDRVLSTLLIELDGVRVPQDQSSEGMAVIGLTHDATLIDPALKRPGRLQKTIQLEFDWK